MYRNYKQETYKQAIGDSGSYFLGACVGCRSRDIAGLCGDIWAWLDRPWNCDIGGYIDVLE
ncbi:hypothetical protein CON05_29130 [Bacillus cereus]|nr:hypothetical protein CON05_29130 [Bacillus cereus]